MKSYAEKDIVLARLAKEHVHEYKFDGPVQGSNVVEYSCACGEIIVTPDGDLPPAATPRAHSTDAMIDYIDKYGFDYSIRNKDSGNNVEVIVNGKTSFAQYSDYNSSSEARKDALYEAIKAAMEAKK